MLGNEEEKEQDVSENQDELTIARRRSLTESSHFGSFDSKCSTLIVGDLSSAASSTHKTRTLTRFTNRDNPSTRRSKSSSPYRSNSHFGFNAPGFPNPNHFHVPKGNGRRFKPLRRSISMEEIFSTRRYLEGGEEQWFNVMAAKFLSKKVLASADQELDAQSINQRDDSTLTSNTVDLAAISEESQSSGNATNESIKQVVAETIEKARELLEREVDEGEEPNKFIETITQMAFSSESTAPLKVNEASITTSFQSLKCNGGDSVTPLVQQPPKIMGRDERDCRKKEFYELWDNHVESLMAQDQNESLEYEVEKFDTTAELIKQEKILLTQLKNIHNGLESRKKVLASEMMELPEQIDAQEKLLLDKLFDSHLSKDETSIFYRIEQSILNKDRTQSRCTSVESTGTQTYSVTNSIHTSTPNNSSSDSLTVKISSSSRIPIRSPKPRVLFEHNESVAKEKPSSSGGAKCKTLAVKKPIQKQVAQTFVNRKVNSNAGAIFSVYKPNTPAKENVNIFQKREKPSPSLWVTMPMKGSKRVAQSPLTPRTVKKSSKSSTPSTVTLRKKVSRAAPELVNNSIHENRTNTFREMDLETEKLRGTIDRCTVVISDIGQSMEEMKESLTEVATVQKELNEELKARRMSE